MFITKTMNESADIELEQFDLVDSICESYEDLLNFNEALAHFDIKEQELIHTESADLDAFREEAMEKAKQFLSNLVAKIKAKWYQFIAYLTKKIITSLELRYKALAKITDLNKRLNDFSAKYRGVANLPFGGLMGKIPEYKGKPVEISQFIKVVFTEILPKELDVITDIAFNKTQEDRKSYDFSKRFKEEYGVKDYVPNVGIGFGSIETFVLKVDVKAAMANIKTHIKDGKGYIDDAMKKLDNFKAETKEIASAANWVMVQCRKNYMTAVVRVQRYFYAIVNGISNIALGF
jgi:hypothetical protein